MRAIDRWPLLAGVVVAAPVVVRGAEDPLSHVQRFASAREQFDHACEQRSRLSRAASERWVSDRERVAACFTAVHAWFPSERPLAAEAAFRAAELLRVIGESARARTELERAVELGEGTEFRARALLELGHLERRRRRWSNALDRYLTVAGDASAPSQRRDEGAIWAGKTYAALGQMEDARRQFVRVAELSSDPLQRLRAFDEWALSFLVTDDIEAATGVLARCRVALAPFAEEQTELGARMRRSLSRLRCIRAIEIAVAKRLGAHAQHADELDHDRDDE